MRDYNAELLETREVPQPNSCLFAQLFEYAALTKEGMAFGTELMF